MTNASKLGMIIGCVLTPLFAAAVFAEIPGTGHAGGGMHAVFFFPIPILVGFTINPIIGGVLAIAQFPALGWTLAQRPTPDKLIAFIAIRILQYAVALHVLCSLAALLWIGVLVMRR